MRSLRGQRRLLGRGGGLGGVRQGDGLGSVHTHVDPNPWLPSERRRRSLGRRLKLRLRRRRRPRLVRLARGGRHLWRCRTGNCPRPMFVASLAHRQFVELGPELWCTRSADASAVRTARRAGEKQKTRGGPFFSTERKPHARGVRADRRGMGMTHDASLEASGRNPQNSNCSGFVDSS